VCERETEDIVRNFVNICPCNLFWPVSLSRPSLYLTSDRHGSTTEAANLKEDITSKVICRSIYIYIYIYELGLNRRASTSSNSLFKDLTSPHYPLGLQFSRLPGILLLFILVICRSQFGLYLLSFSLIGSKFNSSEIS